jgi:hypothetical protein
MVIPLDPGIADRLTGVAEYREEFTTVV